MYVQYSVVLYSSTYCCVESNVQCSAYGERHACVFLACHPLPVSLCLSLFTRAADADAHIHAHALCPILGREASVRLACGMMHFLLSAGARLAQPRPCLSHIHAGATDAVCTPAVKGVHVPWPSQTWSHTRTRTRLESSTELCPNTPAPFARALTLAATQHKYSAAGLVPPQGPLPSAANLLPFEPFHLQSERAYVCTSPRAS